MKKLLILILTICFLVFSVNTSIAQQGEKKLNKEKVKTEKLINKGKAEGKEIFKEEVEKREDEFKNINEEKEKKEKSSKGHAYGKNKDDLKGKEYGQERARQAKLRKEQKVKELDSFINQGELKIKGAKEKIHKSKVKLEKEKKEDTISNADYKKRKDKIDKAERGVMDLEKKINKGDNIKMKNNIEN